METVAKPDIIQDELLQIDDGATRKECSRTLFSNSVASLSNSDNTRVIPITQLDKYVVIFEVNQETSPKMWPEIQEFSGALEKWWNGDKKFLIIAETENTAKVRFERLEKEPNIQSGLSEK